MIIMLGGRDNMVVPEMAIYYIFGDVGVFIVSGIFILCVGV